MHACAPYLYVLSMKILLDVKFYIGLSTHYELTLCVVIARTYLFIVTVTPLLPPLLLILLLITTLYVSNVARRWMGKKLDTGVEYLRGLKSVAYFSNAQTYSLNKLFW
jgi:hypothetical protein